MVEQVCGRKEGGVPVLGPRVGDTQDAKFGDREEDQGVRFIEEKPLFCVAFYFLRPNYKTGETI